MNDNGIFIMFYKGVEIRAKQGKYCWYTGWIPRSSDSLRQAKYQITRWINS